MEAFKIKPSFNSESDLHERLLMIQFLRFQIINWNTPVKNMTMIVEVKDLNET